MTLKVLIYDAHAPQELYPSFIVVKFSVIVFAGLEAMIA